MRFPELKLLSERKICELVRCDKRVERWEASGVLVKEGSFWKQFVRKYLTGAPAIRRAA